MPTPVIKYKIMYMETNPTKSLQILMEEAQMGVVFDCNSPREIKHELEEEAKKGWYIRVKQPVRDWGYILYMEKLK